MRDSHLLDMREVGRCRELKDEPAARRIPAFELLERVADVAAKDDWAFVGLHDDHLMSGGVSRRGQELDAGRISASPSCSTYVAPGKSTHSRTV